jgi:DNA-binding NtrC family response regulator
MQDLLLIDDDTRIVGLLSEKFGQAGFKVHCTDRMDLALDLFKRHPIGLVITDFHIQQGSGRKLVHEIKKIRPDTPVFLITGTPFVTEADFIIYGFDQIFLKPFSIESLISAVKKALL